ncbi:MAG: lysine--tRNA ligase [Candidatus Pacearchaeota archaeon]|jgi:lysyl-tRNA synthetase class 2
MGREEEIIKERERKIKELKEKGINPYAHKFDKKNLVKECLDAKMGEKVQTAGRVMTKREIGKITFSDLMDFTGRIQIVFQDKETPDKDFDFFTKFVDVGDIIGVEGKIVKTKTGQHSILVKKMDLLTKSILPLPDKWHGLQDKEERYRKRYLDLIMNPEIRKVFEVRRKIFDYVREFMKSKDFVEVETPILQPIYGGTNARPFGSKLHALNMEIFLRISNELYLKRLVVGGYERVFEFSPDFRNEGIDKYHNPEFTQVETMFAYADYNDNMKFAEEMVSYIVKKIHGKTKIKVHEYDIDFKAPWKKLSFLDAIKLETKIDFSKIKNIGDAKKTAEKIDVDCKKCETIGEVMIHVFEEKVQAKIIQPTLVYDYPVEAAGLAKHNEKKPGFVDSFEIIVNGMELGLSYCEQNDPHVLENYWKFAEAKFKHGDLEAQPTDPDFINALKVGMPPTSGLGMGIDRLAILLTNSPSIRDVILFPFMKPEK